MLCLPETVRACGYSFIGECSTGIHLKINNTADSFQIAYCSSGHHFDGLELGVIQSLSLINGRAITWESCQNNVTAVLIYYRVYLEGGPVGVWSWLSLQEDYNTLEGPYTARYRSKPTNQDLASGLTIGSKYVMEVYVEAAVDTIGDDNIPETTMVQNNSGQNYHLRFTYGGANAPPFTVVKTLKTGIACHGDSTGVIGVTVYGDQTGLFYHWSNINSNFFAQFNLPSGTYTVTVSGSSAYTASQSFLLDDPPPLTLQENVEICFGQIYLRGGIAFVQSGNYALTLPGSGACDTSLQLHLEVLDPGAGIYALPEQAELTCNVPSLELCALELPSLTFTWYKFGASYQNGPCTTITSEGYYSVVAKMVGSSLTCTVSKSILVSEHTAPPTLSAGASATLGCNTPDTISVVFKAITDAQNPVYSWMLNGQLLSTADTCLFTLANSFPLPVFPTVQVMDTWGCSASAEAVLDFIQVVPILAETSAVPASGPGNADGSAQISAISGGTPPYIVVWENGATGNIITGLLPGVYCVLVSDAGACSLMDCVTVGFVSGTSDPGLHRLSIQPNLLSPGGTVHLALPVHAGAFTLQWIDAQGRLLHTESYPDSSLFETFITPAYLPCGMVFLRVFNSDFQAIGTLYLH